MISLRRATARFLSSRPSASLSSNVRSLHSFGVPLARFPNQEKTAFVLQRRFASEEAVPKPDTEVEAKQKQDAPSEEHASTSSGTPEPQAEAENLMKTASETISNAASSASETASTATEAVSGTASAVGNMFKNTFSPPADSTSIYVGNLFFDVKEKDIQDEFSRVGPLKTVRLIKDPQGMSKGFGYVEFESPEDANKAMETYNQQIFHGRRMNVQKANRKSYRPQLDRPRHDPTKTLFIGNLPYNMGDRDLNNLFRNVKDVIDVRVAIDRRTGQPRGFAHAEFTDVESASKAYKDLEKVQFLGRSLRLDYSTSSGRAVMRDEALDRHKSPDSSFE